MEIPNWLIMANLDSNMSEEEVINQLFDMIQSTNRVTSVESLKKDIANKNKRISPYYSDDTYFCNTRTLSVNDFCAAIIILPDNSKYCISAWRDFSEESLENICMLSEYMNIPNR